MFKKKNFSLKDYAAGRQEFASPKSRIIILHDFHKDFFQTGLDEVTPQNRVRQSNSWKIQSDEVTPEKGYTK